MKIVIDIGHGSNTYPPSKGFGDFAEWDFNNRVGKLAKELAEINGFEVYLSQPLDAVDRDLNERIVAINTEKCDFGISIHANAGVRSASGHEFWYWHNSEQSRKLATLMDANAIALLPNKRRGLKQSKPEKNINFGILRATRCPFVLGEFGFFTNAEDRELLKSDEFVKQCAKVVVKTACDYVGKPFKMYPDTKSNEPIKVPAWKVAGLKGLHEAGIVNDFEQWLVKLDEPAPNWLVFALVNRLREQEE